GAAQETALAVLDSQDVRRVKAHSRIVGLAILRVVALALPKPRFGRLHRQKNVQSEGRAVAFGRVGIIGIHASRFLLPGDDAPKDAVADVDSNVGPPVGGAPFAGRLRLGGSSAARKQKCRSPDRGNRAHDASEVSLLPN